MNIKLFLYDVRVPLLVLAILITLLMLTFTEPAQDLSKWLDRVFFDYTCEPVPFNAPADYEMVCYTHDGTPA